MEIERLMPLPNPDSRPYWDGLKDRRLMLQRCTDCGTIRHYPRPVCDKCFSMEHDWVEASGDATVHSWSTSHHAFHPSFKAELPMTFVTADLAEGVRLLGVWRGEGEPSVDQALVVGFEDVEGADFTVPVLYPA